MINYAKARGVSVEVRIYGNALIHRSRNLALATTREDVDFVMLLDDDMLPEQDALVRMLRRNVPVVTALCTTRHPPVEIAAKVYKPEEDQFHPLATVNLDRMITGSFGVGTAFVLIKREVIETLIEYHLSAQDWLEENRRRLDRMHVRAEMREKERAHIEEIRRLNFSKDKHMRLFDYQVIENEQQLGEDITFSRRLIKCGIPVAIDGTLHVGHVGEYAYSVMDILDEESKSKVMVA